MTKAVVFSTLLPTWENRDVGKSVQEHTICGVGAQLSFSRTEGLGLIYVCATPLKFHSTSQKFQRKAIALKFHDLANTTMESLPTFTTEVCAWIRSLSPSTQRCWFSFSGLFVC